VIPSEFSKWVLVIQVLDLDLTFFILEKRCSHRQVISKDGNRFHVVFRGRRKTFQGPHVGRGLNTPGLEVSAEKTKYVIISRDQHAGQNHDIKIGNKSFQRVEELWYLGTTITNQNSIQEEIKSRLKSGNTYYRLVQDLLSSSLLIEIIKITVHRTVTLPFFVWVWSLVSHCEGWTWSEGVQE
jgi:hypothetical protein